MAKKKEINIDKLSFEKAITLLEEIVEKVESGEIPLEEAIDQYELGCKLIQRCKKILQDAERKIEILSKDIDGNFKSEPFEPDQIEEQ